MRPQPKISDLSTEDQLLWLFNLTAVALAVRVAIGSGMYQGIK